MAERAFQLKDKDEAAILFGIHDRNLRKVRDVCQIKTFVRDGDLHLQGSKKNIDRAHTALERMREIVGRSGVVREDDVARILGVADEPPKRRASDSHRMAEARTDGQKDYLDALQKYEIVFAIGPAGTGKTFLAVSRAMEALQAGDVRRIVLVRPAVEAGEKLGFLPGDFHAKVNPYLRPLYDALNSFLEFGQLRRMIENEVVEVVPLAYMRGRTLDDAFIIMDEAQNTTPEQMKMFLTRMGMRARIVVTGDKTQIDLEGKRSGLIEAERLLSNVDGIGMCYLSKSDIVRHPLVQKIVEAYDQESSEKRD